MLASLDRELDSDDVVGGAEAQLHLARTRAGTRPSDVVRPVVSPGRERRCQRRTKRGESKEHAAGAQRRHVPMVPATHDLRNRTSVLGLDPSHTLTLGP